MPVKFTDDEFITAWKRLGSPAAVAQALGLNLRGVYARRIAIEKKHGFILDTVTEGHGGRPKAVMPKIGARAISENVTGTVIVASDLHAWPGDRSVAFAALVELVRELKPSLLIANGDSVDMASISRHPPIGWQTIPTVLEELDAAKELHAELESAAPAGTPLVWLYGNHCLRFNSRLAAEAAEFRGIPGMSLEDHFPAWDFAMSMHLNKSTVIFHSYHNGVHAAYNNTVKSGVSTVTGHTHRLQAVQWADYNGLRWGIECGTLSDFGPDQGKFAYALDRPVNWSQGFCVLTYDHTGRLLEPEFCRVLDGTAYFRGQSVYSKSGAVKITPQKRSKQKQAA
jgi:hypothetical protein